MTSTTDRTLYLIEAALLILLGLVAITIPGFFTLSLELLCGIILLVTGVYQAYSLWRRHHETYYGWILFGAILNIVLGILLLLNPIAGMITLTVLLIIYFFVGGAIQIAWAWQLRPSKYWGGIAFSGALSIVMGILLILGWPGSAIWAIGLLFGINILFSGIALWALAWQMPKDRPQVPKL